VQKHDIDVTKGVELTSAISAKCDQREWDPGRAILASSRRSRSTENVLQQDINQLRSSRTDFAATTTGLVLQAQPMLLNLEKLLVKREDFGWTPGTRSREALCGMRQNLF
jgi:pectin methylesterase-like acyl-CoA thioesterase